MTAPFTAIQLRTFHKSSREKSDYCIINVDSLIGLDPGWDQNATFVYCQDQIHFKVQESVEEILELIAEVKGGVNLAKSDAIMQMEEGE